MAIQPEAPASLAGEQARSVAFGLLLEVDPNLRIPGIPHVDAPGTPSLEISDVSSPDALSARDLELPVPEPQLSPPASSRLTHVRLDPEELARRWSSAEPASERVRELRDGETLLLSVELAPLAGYLVRAPGFGRILIAPDGTELICAPESDGSSDWSILLPAQALPLAATLQGLEVLHASGVVLRGRATLLTGPPGAGKSSLAAALLRHGAPLLSDDTVALEPHGDTLVAHPGAALLQLRAAEYDRLSAPERAVLGSPEGLLDKQRYSPRVSASPAPFGELFLLERSTQGPPVERIEAVDPFALLASTFNLSVRTPERLTRHLDLAVALAATERIHRLRIQPDMHATRLAEIVHEYLEAS
jgi:hypothetical protein